MLLWIEAITNKITNSFKSWTTDFIQEQRWLYREPVQYAMSTIEILIFVLQFWYWYYDIDIPILILICDFNIDLNLERLITFRSDVDYIENQCTKHLPDCSYTAAKKVKTGLRSIFQFNYTAAKKVKKRFKTDVFQFKMPKR